MPDQFFEAPVLNSPYEPPTRYWELDPETRQPTNDIIDGRRRPATYMTPVPKPRKQRGQARQEAMPLDVGKGLSIEDYDPTSTINQLRRQVDAWRALPRAKWGVTPETARLLEHWRHHEFSRERPFFCQVEAVETVIWLTEVAPKQRRNRTEVRNILDRLDRANEQANPDLARRLALKLATGAGKTTVMAMLIAWQTVNAARRPNSPNFTKGFLVVAPGLTIRDRLRVLQPNDPESYYANRELVPRDMMRALEQAKIVITNFHAFKRRETLALSTGGRRLLQGQSGPKIESTESSGEMLRRVMPDLMGMRDIMVFNDEAHHCYRERPPEEGEEDEVRTLTGDDRKEAEQNREAARLWISGLEAVHETLGVRRVIDLSATPFFLRGSGYAEGTLFPWTMSDFSLMDAIECGIVKLPRVPVADNIPGADTPLFRNLWEHIRKKMPKQRRAKGGALDPLSIPVELETALEALYGHYEKTFQQWEQTDGVDVPPCFIIVCNNTATSKLVYDYVAGFEQRDADGSPVTQADGSPAIQNGRLPLFQNYDANGVPYDLPRTLLIDSAQIESGEQITKEFLKAAADQIERFRSAQRRRKGAASDTITNEDLLREITNTVGKQGQLGESIRCVVSVSMLTEGWDANTVTHILGVRAFGTQLLCEQVVGRALRRQSYDLDENRLLRVEYADVLGVPFDFTAQPTVVKPQPAIDVVQVRALSPERDHLEIRFPNVAGYRVELPDERLTAKFTPDSTLELTPELVGPTRALLAGIVGESHEIDVDHLKDVRQATILFHLTKRLLEKHYRDPNGDPKLHLFGQLKKIARQWLDHHLVCKGGTFPAQLLYQGLADRACDRINLAITRALVDERPERPLLAVPDPYNATGSTQHVRFTTSKKTRWLTSPQHCHVNWAVCDSDWEAEFCRVVEAHPRVRAYVKNQGLGFAVPYLMGAEPHRYIPDFIVRLDDGRGEDDLLNLVVEVKGYRGEDAKVKRQTMEARWIPGVNRLGSYGRWRFAEFTEVYDMEKEFAAVVADALEASPATDAVPSA